MGRKATGKSRKQDKAKKADWANKIFEYFQQEGINRVTMNMVAGYLGKSKSTLYEYFKSKDEILYTVLAVKLESLGGYKAILEDAKTDYIKRYRRFLDFIREEISGISNYFLRDLKSDFPEHWQLVNNFLDEMLAELHEYYKGGVDRCAFKNISIPLLLAQDRHFIFEVLTNPEFMEKQPLTMEEIVDHYLRLKLEGLKQ